MYAVGLAAALPAVDRPLADTDGHTLAEPLTTRTDLPAFPTSSVDGWAVRGTGPWRVVGRVLAGAAPRPADRGRHDRRDRHRARWFPTGTSAVLRVEESTRTADGLVDGVPRAAPEWRAPRRGGAPPARNCCPPAPRWTRR